MFVLEKTCTVEVAHFLPEHPGQCKNLHGHSIEITVTLRAENLNSQGMVADFGDIKKIINQFDHRCLNDLPQFNGLFPTSENLAQVIADECDEKFPNVSGILVEVKETENSYVRFEHSW